MRPGQDGQRIGPDFIGGIAIGRDAIGADDDFINFPLLHQKARHIIGNQRGGDFFLFHFPGGKSRSLQDRPGFIHINVQFLALGVRRPDDAQCGAVACRRQRAGIAVCENMVAVGKRTLP